MALIRTWTDGDLDVHTDNDVHTVKLCFLCCLEDLQRSSVIEQGNSALKIEILLEGLQKVKHLQIKATERGREMEQAKRSSPFYQEAKICYVGF